MRVRVLRPPLYKQEGQPTGLSLQNLFSIPLNNTILVVARSLHPGLIQMLDVADVDLLK
jgi:hypothetical protein